MKKILISALALGLLLAFYFAQVAYIGSLAQSFFEQSVRSNDFAEFSSVKFERGFFTSKASFDVAMKPEKYPFERLSEKDAAQFSEYFSASVKMDIKNNIFANHNIIAEFESPIFNVLQEILGDKVKIDKSLFTTTASISLLGKISVLSKLTDIEYREEANILKLTGAVARSEFDSSGKMLKLITKLAEFSTIDASSVVPFSFELKNLSYEEDYGKGVDVASYIGGAYASQGKASVQSANIMGTVLSELKMASKKDVKDFEDDKLQSTHTTLSIKKIESPVMQVFIDDLKSELEMSNVSTEFLRAIYSGELDVLGADKTLQLIFDTKPKITLKALNFSSKGKKFDSKGEISGDKDGFKASYTANSEAKPSEIIPLLAFISPGTDGLFVQNEGKYSLNFTLDSDFVVHNMDLNGEKISFDERQLNGR